MESSTSSAVAAAPAPSFLERHQFLIYRLFSLTGLLPVGGYLCIHLLTNATVLGSPATFQAQVDSIHQLGFILPLIEWTFIFIPILFHAIVGWVIIAGAIPNTTSYPYTSNVRYTLQRVTGIIAFFFILLHVLHMHKHIGAAFAWAGGAKFDPEHAASSASAALQPIGMQIFYGIGVLACVYHLANGLWTFGITWGLWTSPRAQRRASYISLALGLLLAAVGLGALGGMIRVDQNAARQEEDALHAGKGYSPGEHGIEPHGRGAASENEG